MAFIPIFGQKVILNDQKAKDDICNLMSIYEDPTNTLTLKEIQSKTFVPNKKEGLVFPYSNSTFWIKFTVQNLSNKNKDWHMVWGSGGAENMLFYIPQNDGSFREVKEGNLVYKPQNKFTENIVKVPFQTFDNKEHTFFLKIKSQKAHQTDFQILSSDELVTYNYYKFKRESFFNGLLILRLFYVLLLATFIIRDKTFRRYSFYITARSFAYWGLLGILGGVFTTNAQIAQQINYQVYYFLPFAAALVVPSLLDFSRFPKIIQYLYRFYPYLIVALCVIIFFNQSWLWLKISNYVNVILSFITLGLFIVSIIRKYDIEWSYSVPFLLGVLSSLYIPLRQLGVKEFPGSTAFSTLCFVGEIFVFGLYLGKIIRSYEKNKVQVEKDLLFNKEQTAKLQELDLAKTNFFANISHEFRTPLTLILAPIEDLIKKYPTDEPLKIVRRNASRLLELVNQLLDLSKLESGQMPVNLENIALKSYFKRLSSSFTSLAESKQIDFVVKIFNENYSAQIDTDKIEKIVNNLLSNAFKFTPQGKKIMVDISWKNSANIIIKVADEGTGISAEKLDKIFDRFYQADTTSSRKFEGTGIGLSLVKELVDVLEGEIEVESKEGVGTTFTVNLPIKERTLIEEEAVEDAENQTFTKKEKTQKQTNELEALAESQIMLIVDDNEDIRNYIKSVFKNSFKIIEAGNGKEGIVQAKKFVPDMIISDLMMPEMDGFEFCKSLKLDESTSHIPIIMLTAKANIETKIEGLELGADDYLLKPFNTDEIKVRVKNLVEKQERLKAYFSGKTIELKPSEIKVNSKEETFLNKAKEILEKHLSESSFGAEQFASEMNVSQTQFLRKLKALTNLTINEFIRDFRLQRAADLLTKKSSTVSEVAFEVGFESLSYFTKTFKEKFGVLPSEY